MANPPSASDNFLQAPGGQYWDQNTGGILTAAQYQALKAPQTSTSGPSSQTVDYSKLLPSAQDYSSFAPLPYQSFGAVPYTQAATMNPASVGSTPAMQAASVDLSQMPGALSSYEAMVQQALAPTFRQQQDTLTSDLAKRGIFNSTAAQQLENDLSGQQAGALASAYEPLIGQFANAYTQGQQLNANNQQAANETNYTGTRGFNALVAQLQQQAALENQGAMNTANTENAQRYYDVTSGNATALNNYLNELMQAQYLTSSGLTENVLKTYDPQLSSGILSQGLSNAGNAYSNAYQSGMEGAANLSSTLGNYAAQAFGKQTRAPVDTSSWEVTGTA